MLREQADAYKCTNIPHQMASYPRPLLRNLVGAPRIDPG